MEESEQDQEGLIKKRTLVIQACNFCKRRHLKCQGIQPCEQCVKRKEECVFSGVIAKKGRKKKKQPLQLDGSPEEVEIENQMFQFHTIPFHHLAYFAAFAQTIQPSFPSFVPHTYHIIANPYSIQITNPKIFTIMDELNITTARNLSPMDICDAFEYAIICSHGSRVCKEPETSVAFFKRGQVILQILVGFTIGDAALAERVIFLICLFALFNIIHGSVYDSADALLTAYSMYMQHPDTISPVISNRLFASLCGTSPNLEHCWHWINKIKLHSMSYTQAVNYLFTTCYVLLWMVITSTKLTNLSYKPKILQMLLSCVEELNSFVLAEADMVSATLFHNLARATIIVIKREMGIDTGEKELLSAIKVMLQGKDRQFMGFGLTVVLMLSVWSLQVFSEPETKVVVQDCWDYFQKIEPNLGLITLFRAKMTDVRTNPLQITFERLENLAEMEGNLSEL